MDIPSASQKEFLTVIDTVESIAGSNPARTELATGANPGDTVLVVDSVANIQVGDQLTLGCIIPGEPGSDLVEPVEVVAIAGSTLTVASPLSNSFPEGYCVREVNLNSFRVDIIGIEADNVENGQEVILNGLPIQGATLEVISTGQLFVNTNDIHLVGGEVQVNQEVEAWSANVEVKDDDIQVPDLYLRNLGDVFAGELYDFDLRMNGVLIGSSTMVFGELHFQLSNNRIRIQKGTSVRLSVSAERRSSIPAETVSLQLAINVAEEQNGFEARTNTTFRDLDASSLNANQELATGPIFTITP